MTTMHVELLTDRLNLLSGPNSIWLDITRLVISLHWLRVPQRI